MKAIANWKKSHQSATPVGSCFYLCDPEGKGYITKVDLGRVAEDLSLNFEQLDFIFDKLDIDKNGRLTLDEFAEGFGTFLGEGNGSSELDSPKHDGDLSDEFTKEGLQEGQDIFESLEAGIGSATHSSEEALFREIVESVGEDIFTGSLTKDQLRDLWEALRKNDVRGLQKFEEFLGKVSGEIRRAKLDSEQLESALKSKANSHDKEVQKLYEEMEQQIRSEKERIRNEQIKREKALKDELVNELESKELEMQHLLQRQKSLEEAIAKKHETEQDIKNENEKLFQKTMHLEEMLSSSVSSLEDTKSYVNQLQAQTAMEKKERARSGSETSFVTYDKDIATSTTSSSWRENPQNVSNSERRYGQDRIPSIPSDCFREDSAFLSDECDESFYDENGINYCLQKRPGVSSKRHDLNRPLSGSFSSEAGSERNYRYRNEAEVCSEDFGDNAGFLAGRYSQRKENISSVPWHRGQEVISRSPQDTSRKMDDSFDDCYSVDSECYSPDIVEDGYSSTSSADSSFVCFALVGKQEDERMKRKIGSNVGQRDRHKKHRPRRREPEEKDSDHGVMACVVSGISGGPAIRVFRDDDSQKSIARSKRRELEHPRKIKEGSPHGREVKGGATESNTLKGSQFQNERSKETSRGFVFGVFRTPDNPVLAEKQSGIDDGKALNPERGDSSYEVEDAEPYDGRFTAFPENSLKTKPCDDDYFPQATKPR
ncbi:Calcium release activated channel regulator [Desmophyllum pertusum]|uniref:Calcium release activated channel regulator n=1 Tax=Desmophyllum pertusum TaxID=174260 RepID=A0A9W9YZS8_9CNID|nr:Calcium release activated channel regulator [Desmophyllum pertusum]